MDINLRSDFLNFIIRGGYRPGDRLPSIQELTDDAHLDMSANKVREQLEVARMMGWVEVRSKRGTRIKEYAFTPAVRLSALYAMACGERFESFASLAQPCRSGLLERSLRACSRMPTWTDMQACHRQRRSKAALAVRSTSPIPNIASFHHERYSRHLDNTFVLGILEAYWDLYEEVAVNRYDGLQLSAQCLGLPLASISGG